MKPRVFIPQVPQQWSESQGRMVPRFDTLDKAEKFGELIVLLDRNDDIWNPDAVLDKLEVKMLAFNDNDYVLPMGSYLFMMWTTQIATAKCSRRLQTLQWHQREVNYRVIATDVVRFK